MKELIAHACLERAQGVCTKAGPKGMSAERAQAYAQSPRKGCKYKEHFVHIIARFCAR